VFRVTNDVNMDSLLRQVRSAVGHLVWFLSYQADPRDVRRLD